MLHASRGRWTRQSRLFRIPGATTVLLRQRPALAQGFGGLGFISGKKESTSSITIHNTRSMLPKLLVWGICFLKLLWDQSLCLFRPVTSNPGFGGLGKGLGVFFVTGLVCLSRCSVGCKGDSSCGKPQIVRCPELANPSYPSCDVSCSKSCTDRVAFTMLAVCATSEKSEHWYYLTKYLYHFGGSLL